LVGQFLLLAALFYTGAELARATSVVFAGQPRRHADPAMAGGGPAGARSVRGHPAAAPTEPYLHPALCDPRGHRSSLK